VARSSLSPTDLRRLRTLLVEQLMALYRSVRADLRELMVRRLYGQEEPRDEVDESMRVQLRDARVHLAESDARRAREIEDALERMRQGTYGTCVDCGQRIERERLRVLPWAARCILDQTAFEASHREHPPTL
jgi:DnaK suppressor protein